MILQPIVENYFKHGLDRSASDGELMLFAKRLREGQVEILVQNNGAQIPEIRLKQLQQELSQLDSQRPYYEGLLRGASGQRAQAEAQAAAEAAAVALRRAQAEGKLHLQAQKVAERRLVSPFPCPTCPAIHHRPNPTLWLLRLTSL